MMMLRPSASETEKKKKKEGLERNTNVPHKIFPTGNWRLNSHLEIA